MPVFGISAPYVEIFCYLYERSTGKLMWEGSAMSMGTEMSVAAGMKDATNQAIKKFPSKK